MEGYTEGTLLERGQYYIKNSGQAVVYGSTPSPRQATLPLVTVNWFSM